MSEQLESVIGAAHAFAGLDTEQLRLVAGCAEREQAPAGTMLISEGLPAERFCLIENGVVSLEVTSSTRGRLVLSTLGDGDVLGWSWLFAPYRWRFDGRVVEPTAVIAFDGVRLRRECDSDHELGYRLVSNFAQIALGRLQDTRLQLLDVYGNPGIK